LWQGLTAHQSEADAQVATSLPAHQEACLEGIDLHCMHLMPVGSAGVLTVTVVVAITVQPLNCFQADKET